MFVPCEEEQCLLEHIQLIRTPYNLVYLSVISPKYVMKNQNFIFSSTPHLFSFGSKNLDQQKNLRTDRGDDGNSIGKCQSVLISLSTDFTKSKTNKPILICMLLLRYFCNFFFFSFSVSLENKMITTATSMAEMTQKFNRFA